MQYYLYTITKCVNGKQYVGITSDPKRRKREHFSGHGSRLVWQAIQKYGQHNLLFDVLLKGTLSEISLAERTAIQDSESITPNGYNLSLGGDSPNMLGLKHSDATRKKNVRC
jgi:group I intron endonuclease